MNKIVRIHYISLYMNCECVKIQEMDDFMLDSYGMKTESIGADKFTIVDEAKFTLFMLEHSQYIRKISYE